MSEIANQENMQDTGEKKYTANQAIWIVAAVYAYVEYRKSDNLTITDVYMSASQIQKIASDYTTSVVQSIRMYQHCNGDHAYSSNHFLRKIALSPNNVLFRISAKGEFGGVKEIPSDLDWNDSIIYEGEKIVLQDLLDFVQGEYTDFITANVKQEEIDYIAVLDYVNKNSKMPYSDPEKEGLSLDEKKQFEELRDKAQVVVDEMKKMAALCKNNFQLDKSEPIAWLDGSRIKTKSYLWGQMKYSVCAEVPISISMVAELSPQYKKARYRYSLEIRNEGADNDLREQYYRFLDMPLKDDTGLVYVAEEKGKVYVIEESADEIKALLEDGTYKKVLLCRIVEPDPGMQNKDYEQAMLEAVKELIPYYEYVMGLEHSEEEAEEMFQSINDTIEFDKNIILYGPPGTGKTYNSAIYAVAICDGLDVSELTDYEAVMKRYNELKADDRIAFTTFHQSYGYEEFIEGIKPVVNQCGASGDISYKVEPGVFKRFCEEDICEEISEETVSFEEAWKKLIEEAKKNGRKYTFKRRNTGSEKEAILINDTMFRVQHEGETHSYNNFPKKKIKLIFETTKYEDRDNIQGGTRWAFDMCYAVIDTLVEKFGLVKPENSTPKNKVFIIDEINRGNISKIFGELITLIEDSKRKGMPEAASAILPYSGEEFSVPNNVYILGTMNTADRSIALMDTALRRRFQFIEKMPDPKVLEEIKDVDGLNVSKMLATINERIEFLYDREHTIGHAFFMGLKEDPSIGKLASIFSKSIIPLLQEYFYEDYQKIQLVLGDNGKKDEEAHLKFIKDVKVSPKSIFMGDVEDLVDLPEKKFVINQDAFYRIESYKKIAPGL